MDKITPQFLRSLGLAGFEQILPKPAWAQKLQKSMDLITELPSELKSLTSLFNEELQEIVWLSRVDSNATPFASAAYPEVSGKVFVTSAVFSYIPPSQILGANNPYLAFENMIHECLHHRGEKIFRSSPVLSPLMVADEKVIVSWRQTEWTFSHAVQAYYVYVWIDRLRQWRINSLNETYEMRTALTLSLIEVHSIISELEEQLSNLAGLPSCIFRSEVFI